LVGNFLAKNSLIQYFYFFGSGKINLNTANASDFM